MDRLAGDGDHMVSVEMRALHSTGTCHIEVRGEDGEITRVCLDFRCTQIRVLPPIGKQKRYPPRELSVIHATKIGPRSGRKPIEWKLLTVLQVQNFEQTIEKIRWYAMRWELEVFHKILKSGCRAEDAKLRAAD